MEVHQKYPNRGNRFENINIRYQRYKGGRRKSYNKDYSHRDNEQCPSCGLSNEDIKRNIHKFHNKNDNKCFMRGPEFNTHRPTRDRLLKKNATDTRIDKIVNQIIHTNDNDSDSTKSLSGKSDYTSSNENTSHDRESTFPVEKLIMNPWLEIFKLIKIQILITMIT